VNGIPRRGAFLTVGKRNRKNNKEEEEEEIRKPQSV
jgi:hypothetical protein